MAEALQRHLGAQSRQKAVTSFFCVHTCMHENNTLRHACGNLIQTVFSEGGEGDRSIRMVPILFSSSGISKQLDWITTVSIKKTKLKNNNIDSSRCVISGDHVMWQHRRNGEGCAFRANLVNCQRFWTHLVCV